MPIRAFKDRANALTERLLRRPADPIEETGLVPTPPSDPTPADSHSTGANQPYVHDAKGVVNPLAAPSPALSRDEVRAVLERQGPLGLPARVDNSTSLPPARDQLWRLTCTRFAVAAAAEAMLGLQGHLSVEHLVSQVGDIGFVPMPVRRANAEAPGKRHAKPLTTAPSDFDKAVRNIEYHLNHPALIRMVTFMSNPPVVGRVKDVVGGWLEARVFSGKVLVAEEHWPYMEEAKESLKAAPRWQIEGIRTLSLDAKSLKQHLSSNERATAICVLRVDPDYAERGHVLQQSKLGRLVAEAQRTTSVPHAVLLVGYEERTDASGKAETFFKFRNHLGAGWGDEGYGWVSEGYLRSFGLYASTITGMRQVP